MAEKFDDRVISRRMPHAWPAHSPDMSPLDCSLWGHLQQIVYEKNPESLEELKTILDEAASSISEETVRSAAANFRRRVELCLQSRGGHFEGRL